MLKSLLQVIQVTIFKTIPVLMLKANKTEQCNTESLLQNRWESLPESLKTPHQLLGKAAIACGATHHVMEQCNFSCTCCYLGPEANKTKPLPFEQVKEQLDHLRATLGLNGKVQITAGEVTLLPLEDLGRIVKYGRSIDLDLMVMSHGQRFIEEPEYLKSLVQDYGLRKISIHIDTTQRGRPGTRGIDSEKQLHDVRDKAAELIRWVRKETSLPLHAASTVTVTNQNLEGMTDVMEWFFKNADAFRLLSFQPVADVGRTRKRYSSAILNSELWKHIFMAAKRSFNPQPILYGHPKCNNIVPLLAIATKNDYIIFEGLRKDNQEDQNMFAEAMQHFARKIDWSRHWIENTPFILTTFLHNPSFLFRSCKWGIKRIKAEIPLLKKLLNNCWKARSLPNIRPFLLVVHNFMSPDELNTEEGKERLDACSFKLPVDGEMISMCEMNASGLRERIDKLHLKNTATHR